VPFSAVFLHPRTPLGRIKLSRNPEKELSEFLAPLPGWMRRTFQEGFPSLTQVEILDWTKNLEEVSRLTAEYERILRQIPTKWKGYRERLKREARQTAQYLNQYLVPKGKPGAPRKDNLAREAALLHRQGKNFPQIAAALNETLREDGKTTPDAIRKLLKRHPQPDEI
jgi:hypothetical protein